MKTPKPVGFFREVVIGDPAGPSLEQAVAATPQPDEHDALAYLRSGAVFGVSPMVVPDVLSADEVLIGPLKFLTDGEWLWRSDLAYYVEHYHCTLPPEFVATMQAHRWRPPSEDEIDFTEIRMGFGRDAMEDFGA